MLPSLGGLHIYPAQFDKCGDSWTEATMSFKQEPQDLIKAVSNRPCVFCKDHSVGNFVFTEPFNLIVKIILVPT